jgi:hypothetical protein
VVYVTRKRISSVWLASIASSLIAGAAFGDPKTSTSIHCPASTTAGSMPTVDVHLHNNDVTAVGVRILSSFTANQNETAEGAAIAGPVVAAASTVDGSSTKLLSIPAPPRVPSSLAGRLATYVISTEWSGGAKVEAHECLIFVPEPAQTVEFLAGMAGLLIVASRRSLQSTTEETRS